MRIRCRNGRSRPLIKPRHIDITCRAAYEYGAAALGVPMTDTVKRTNADGVIIGTVDRSDLIRIQTPQVFRREEYLELAKKALMTDMNSRTIARYTIFQEKM